MNEKQIAFPLAVSLYDVAQKNHLNLCSLSKIEDLQERKRVAKSMGYDKLNMPLQELQSTSEQKVFEVDDNGMIYGFIFSSGRFERLPLFASHNTSDDVFWKLHKAIKNDEKTTRISTTSDIGSVAVAVGHCVFYVNNGRGDGEVSVYVSQRTDGELGVQNLHELRSQLFFKADEATAKILPYDCASPESVGFNIPSRTYNVYSNNGVVLFVPLV